MGIRRQSIFQINLIILSNTYRNHIFFKSRNPLSSWPVLESETGCKFLGNMRDGFRWIALYSMFALLHSSIFNIRSLALLRPSFGLISRSKMEDRALHCAHKSFGKTTEIFWSRNCSFASHVPHPFPWWKSEKTTSTYVSLIIELHSIEKYFLRITHKCLSFFIWLFTFLHFRYSGSCARLGMVVIYLVHVRQVHISRGQLVVTAKAWMTRNLGRPV